MHVHGSQCRVHIVVIPFSPVISASVFLVLFLSRSCPVADRSFFFVRSFPSDLYYPSPPPPPPRHAFAHAYPAVSSLSLCRVLPLDLSLPFFFFPVKRPRFVCTGSPSRGRDRSSPLLSAPPLRSAPLHPPAGGSFLPVAENQMLSKVPAGYLSVSKDRLHTSA